MKTKNVMFDVNFFNRILFTNFNQLLLVFSTICPELRYSNGTAINRRNERVKIYCTR